MPQAQIQVNQMTPCVLTESTALRLQKESNVHTLDLSKFTIITPSAAKVVTSFNCHLILDGLNSMDEATARVLCNHPGNLQLNGLSELSEGLIKIMVQHKGMMAAVGSALRPLAKRESSRRS